MYSFHFRFYNVTAVLHKLPSYTFYSSSSGGRDIARTYFIIVIFSTINCNIFQNICCINKRLLTEIYLNIPCEVFTFVSTM